MYKTLNNSYGDQFIRNIVYDNKWAICYFLYNCHEGRRIFEKPVFDRLVNIAFSAMPDLDRYVNENRRSMNLAVVFYIEKKWREKRSSVMKGGVNYDFKRCKNLDSVRKSD